MRKLKLMWEKNKVLIVLLLILLICFVAICTVVITYFFGGSETVYGERLKDIDKYPITETFKDEYIATLSADETINEVEFSTKGRVIYVTIDFVPDIALVEAESKAAASIQSFDPDVLTYYDLNFILNSSSSENSDGFTIFGAKNTTSEGVVWNNYTQIESEEE